MWTCIWKCNVCFSIITVNKLLKTFSLVSFFLHEKKSFTQSALKKSVSCSLKSEMKVSHVDLYKTVWELRRNWKWNSNSLWKKKDFQTNQELQVCVDLYWSLKANHIPFGKKETSQLVKDMCRSFTPQQSPNCYDYSSWSHQIVFK